MTDTVGPAPQYDAFADEFLDHASEGPYQKGRKQADRER
jgi:hypothetical protein